MWGWLVAAGLASLVHAELFLSPCYSAEGAPEQCLLLEQKREEDVEAGGWRPEARGWRPEVCGGCESAGRLLDLGPEYAPRYLPSVECAGPCWRGPLRCRPRQYEVKVLKRRDEADEVTRRRDLSLPEPLREEWKFVLVKVSVACECSL